MNIKHPDIVIKYIKTKNKVRKIISYKDNESELRYYHQNIKEFLEERFVPSIFSKGYVKNRSIYHNALSHMYNDYFIMVDIKDFFNNICHKKLLDKLYYEINLLKPNQINMRDCRNIIDSCSVDKRGIPLGFITSPILSNIYLKEFDNIFYGKLKKIDDKINIIYTRYVDDMVISFRYNNQVNCDVMKENILCICKDTLYRYGLKLNNGKIRFYDFNISNHIKITGVNIIKQKDGKRRLTIGKSIKNKLFWEALECVKSKNKKKIQHVKGIQSFILSIEKTGYESCYSKTMMKLVNDVGYDSLKSLIDSL